MKYPLTLHVNIKSLTKFNKRLIVQKFYLIFFLFILSAITLAQTPITTYTVTKTNGNCFSNSSIAISFPNPGTNGYESGWLAELSIQGSSSVQPSIIEVPINGATITFSNLSNNNYELKLVKGGSQLPYSGNPINITSTYVNMTTTSTSIPPTCPTGTMNGQENGTITINISSGGVGPFLYTVSSPSVGIKTIQTTDRNITISGMKGGETVLYAVQDKACNATVSSSSTIPTNQNIPLQFADREYNFVRDCSDCQSVKLYVNLRAASVNIENRLTTITALNNAQITIGGINYPLTYLGLVSGGAYQFTYDPKSGEPKLKNGDQITTTFNWGCGILSNTETVVMDDAYLRLTHAVNTDYSNCSIKYRLIAFGEEDNSHNRNIYFCRNPTVVLKKRNPTTNLFDITVDTKTMIVEGAGKTIYPAASIDFILSESGEYQVTASDGCHTITRTRKISPASTPLNDISVFPTNSILQGTGGLNITSSPGTGLYNLKYPLKVKIERVDGQKSMVIHPSGPYNVAGSYTITFPFELIYSANPGNNSSIIDLPLGQYKLTFTDNCFSETGISRSITASVINSSMYSPTVFVQTGCLQSNIVSYDLRSTFILFPRSVQLINKNVNGTEGSIIAQNLFTNNSSGIDGIFSNIPSGSYYLKYVNTGVGYSAARQSYGPFHFRTELEIPPYQNIDIDISTQFCDVKNQNSGIVHAQVKSGSLKYPLTMALYDQSNPNEPIQGPYSIPEGEMGKVFKDVSIGHYFIRTSSLCYTFDKNFSIQATTMPPIAEVSNIAVCPNSPSTAVALSATNNLYDITWYLKNTSTIVGYGMPIRLTPSVTTTYTAKFQLKPSFNCNNKTIYESDVTVNVTPNPNLIIPKVTDISLCNNPNPFVTISNSESDFIYEVLNSNLESFNPKAITTGNGGLIHIVLPNTITPRTKLQIMSTNGNAGCKGILADVIDITQTTPNITLDIQGSMVCNGHNGSISIRSSEKGITYTILKEGKPLSPNLSAIGTGSDLLIEIPHASLTTTLNEFSIQVTGMGCHPSELIEKATIINQRLSTTITISNAHCNETKGSLILHNVDGSGIYRYSLDNNTWQSSNLFSQLAPSTYTYYTQDSLSKCQTKGTIEILKDCFEISKKSTSTYYNAVGNVINYNIMVTNTGTSTLTNIKVIDPKATLHSSNIIPFLDPGNQLTLTASYTITQAEMDAGFFENIAYATYQSISKSGMETVYSITTPPSKDLELKGRWVNIHDVELNWITTKERKTHYFIIERSINGIDFIPIGNQIKAAGNSSTILSYVAYDRDLKYATNLYYRVRMVNFDSTSRLSNTILLRKKMNSGIRVYPNPVRDIIKIEFDLMGLYEISLYGFNGQLIKQIDTIQISSGSKAFTIERNTIHEGSYILRILNKNSGEIHHIKLILL